MDFSIADRNKTIINHFGLIGLVIKRCRYERLSLTFDDLFQEGVIGLIKAIAKFDHKKGEFSTYAYFWIRSAIVRAIMDKDRIVSVPNYALTRGVKFTSHSSLNEKIYDDVEIIDLIPSPNTEIDETEEKITNALIVKQIINSDILSELEKQILKMRLIGMSHRTIGKKIGISHEWVRKHEGTAHQKIKEKFEKD